MLSNSGDRFAVNKQIVSLKYKREDRDRSLSANGSKKPPLATDRSTASIIAEMHF
jgi:hypothetical protein